jgi:hypothetical protein
MTLENRDLNARDIQLVEALPDHWPAIRDLLLATGLPLDGAQDHLANFVVVQQGRLSSRPPASRATGTSDCFVPWRFIHVLKGKESGRV